jgi:hypothetical protein
MQKYVTYFLLFVPVGPIRCQASIFMRDEFEELALYPSSDDWFELYGRYFNKELYLLRYNAVQSVKSQMTFREEHFSSI